MLSVGWVTISQMYCSVLTYCSRHGHRSRELGSNEHLSRSQSKRELGPYDTSWALIRTTEEKASNNMQVSHIVMVHSLELFDCLINYEKRRNLSIVDGLLVGAYPGELLSQLQTTET